jgi:hypothetical protein
MFYSYVKKRKEIFHTKEIENIFYAIGMSNTYNKLGNRNFLIKWSLSYINYMHYEREKQNDVEITDQF